MKDQDRDGKKERKRGKEGRNAQINVIYLFSRDENT